jgi:hypothetical protein
MTGSWRQWPWCHVVISWRRRPWRQDKGLFFEIFPQGAYLRESFEKRAKNKKRRTTCTLAQPAEPSPKVCGATTAGWAHTWSVTAGAKGQVRARGWGEGLRGGREAGPFLPRPVSIATHKGCFSWNKPPYVPSMQAVIMSYSLSSKLTVVLCFRVASLT